MLYDIISLPLLLLPLLISINWFSLSKNDAFRFPRAAHISNSVSGTTSKQFGIVGRVGFRVKEDLSWARSCPSVSSTMQWKIIIPSSPDLGEDYRLGIKDSWYIRSALYILAVFTLLQVGLSIRWPRHAFPSFPPRLCSAWLALPCPLLPSPPLEIPMHLSSLSSIWGLLRSFLWLQWLSHPWAHKVFIF